MNQYWSLGKHAMRILPLTLVCSVGALGSAHAVQAQDMREHLERTRALVQQRQYAEALDRFVWFHQNALDHEPSMAGVRLSYALRDWQRLGQVYPPAMEALINTRELTYQNLLASPVDRQLFLDHSGFNRFFDEPQRTLETFDLLVREHPDAALSHWDIARSVAIESRRFDLLRTHGVDLIQEFEREAELRAYVIARTQDRPAFMTDRATALYNARLTTQSLLLIEAALALDQVEVAKMIQERALQIVPDERLRRAVPQN